MVAYRCHASLDSLPSHPEIGQTQAEGWKIPNAIALGIAPRAIAYDPLRPSLRRMRASRRHRQVEGAWRAGPGRVAGGMSPPAAKSPYAGHRFPAEVISQ